MECSKALVVSGCCVPAVGVLPDALSGTVVARYFLHDYFLVARTVARHGTQFLQRYAINRNEKKLVQWHEKWHGLLARVHEDGWECMARGEY